MSDAIEVIEADLGRPDHQRAVLDLLSGYARDPMELGRDLPEEVRRNLVPALRRHPTTMIFLACRDATPVGIAVCFLGFSTFKARPLINVHDLAVDGRHRNQGVGRRLLERVEAKARELRCCKLTLEVQENNRPAQALYRSLGFGSLPQQPGAGDVFFWAKPLQ